MEAIHRDPKKSSAALGSLRRWPAKPTAKPIVLNLLRHLPAKTIRPKRPRMIADCAAESRSFNQIVGPLQPLKPMHFFFLALLRLCPAPSYPFLQFLKIDGFFEGAIIMNF